MNKASITIDQFTEALFTTANNITEVVKNILNIEKVVFSKNSSSISEYYSIYEAGSNLTKIMKSGRSITYLKGLGEMNPCDLAETTMNIKTRKLIQIKDSEDTSDNMEMWMYGNEVMRAKRRNIITEQSVNYNIDELI